MIPSHKLRFIARTEESLEFTLNFWQNDMKLSYLGNNEENPVITKALHIQSMQAILHADLARARNQTLFIIGIAPRCSIVIDIW
jgi:hypothetical protein